MQIISGSMMMQKDIQEQLGKLKTHIDERQKVRAVGSEEHETEQETERLKHNRTYE